MRYQLLLVGIIAVLACLIFSGIGKAQNIVIYDESNDVKKDELTTEEYPDGDYPAIPDEWDEFIDPSTGQSLVGGGLDDKDIETIIVGRESATRWYFIMMFKADPQFNDNSFHGIILDRDNVIEGNNHIEILFGTPDGNDLGAYVYDRSYYFFPSDLEVTFEKMENKVIKFTLEILSSSKEFVLSDYILRGISVQGFTGHNYWYFDYVESDLTDIPAPGISDPDEPDDIVDDVQDDTVDPNDNVVINGSNEARSPETQTTPFPTAFMIISMIILVAIILLSKRKD